LTADSPADSQALAAADVRAAMAGKAAPRAADGETVPGAESSNAPALPHFELTDPDVRLMLSVRQGNAAAFEQLVRRYQDRILSIMRHLITNKESAEDLTQDVFLRVYRARENYLPNAKFSTWIFTITQNVARNANRQFSRKREQQLSGSSSDSGRQPTLEQMATDASGLQPARQLAQMEMGQVVRLALESLPERQRMAVLLAKFEAMSYQEIADTMGLTVPAIKSLLSRARNNLKEALQPYLDAGMLPKPANEGPA